MAKFSILTASELMEEESEIQSAIKFQIKKEKNPYWGLRCNRGLWLTRFPLESLPVDPEFTMAYVQAGGGFDWMDHWGVRPELLKTLEQDGWSHEQVALFGQGVPKHLCQFDGVTPSNFKVLDKGLKRAEALNKMQVSFSCSVWTLGRIPLKSFVNRLFKNGIKVTSRQGYLLEINHILFYRPYYKGRRTYYGNINKAPEAIIESVPCGKREYNVSELIPKKFLSYLRKCKDEKSYSSEEETSKESYSFGSLKAAKIFAKYCIYDSWLEGLTTKRTNIKGNFIPVIRPKTNTSYGGVYLIHSRLILAVDKGIYHGDPQKKKLSSIREVSGYSTTKIGSTWFVWKQNFHDHIESYTGGLREAVSLYEKREKKNSLILTLNDVRNDRSGTAGFCLAGTKSFLQDRMPFLYNLIAQFNSWASIPEDIMGTEFHLVSKDIFRGYPSPVR